MGTGYDLFGRQGAYGVARDLRRSSAAGATKLVAVMARQGFVNYSQEWWHFFTARRGVRRLMISRSSRAARDPARRGRSRKAAISAALPATGAALKVD